MFNLCYGRIFDCQKLWCSLALNCNSLNAIDDYAKDGGPEMV